MSRAGQRQNMAAAFNRGTAAEPAAAAAEGAAGTAAATGPAAARPTAARPPRVKPVRITVDLDPDLHRRLKLWAVESDDARMADVVRVLAERMLSDDQLAAAVRADLVTRQGR